MVSYQDAYDASIERPDEFWAEQADLSTGSPRPDRSSTGPARRSTAGSPAAGSTPATTRSTGTSSRAAPTRPRSSTTARSPAAKRSYTYAELLEQTAAFAGALTALGVEPGDRVVIYMPMIPEAVIAMLACARLGAVHSVVFGGFAAAELAVRIDDAQPEGDRVGVVRDRAGPGRRLQALAGQGLGARRTPAGRRRHQAARAARGRARRRPRHRLGAGVQGRAGPIPRRAPRSTRPTRCTSSTRPARRASPRASSATTAVMRSRWPGRCPTCSTSGPGRCGGPPPTSAGSSGTPTSSTRRSSSARPRSCTRASRSAPRMRARSGG